MQIKIFEHLPEDAKKIRKSVFMEEQGFENEFDEIDERATHLVLYEGENPVATCRIFRGDRPDAYIFGRLAVMASHRGQQLGSRMLGEAEQVVRSKRGATIALHAQCRVRKFYEQSGYEAFGEVDEDEGCPHIWMKKKI